MTGDDKKERNALDQLVDALVDDILDAPDEDILAEFWETDGDPERYAVEMRELFERGILIVNKKRPRPEGSNMTNEGIGPQDLAGPAVNRLRAQLPESPAISATVLLEETISRLTRERDEARAALARARAIIDKWTKADHLKLHAGEMTPQEVRTVLAVLAAIKREVER